MTDNIEEVGSSQESIDMPENLSTNTESTEAPKSFLDNVSEDLRQDPSLKDFKDINSLAKSYINANKMIGRSDIPNSKSTPEEWSKFYNKLGRPDASDKYELPEGQEETELLTQFRDIAHEKGLNNQQFQDIVNLYNGFEKQTMTKQEELSQVFQEQFKEEFGEKANTVKDNAIALIGKYASDEDKQILNSLDGTATIALARIFDKMATSNLKEGSLQNGESSNITSLVEINDRMKEIKTKDMFYGDNKEYQELTMKRRNLFTQGVALH